MKAAQVDTVGMHEYILKCVAINRQLVLSSCTWSSSQQLYIRYEAYRAKLIANSQPNLRLKIG